MECSADGLNLLTAREQVVLPDSEESCRQDPGLEAGRLPAAGLGSCSTVQPPSSQHPHYRDSGLGKTTVPSTLLYMSLETTVPRTF